MGEGLLYRSAKIQYLLQRRHMTYDNIREKAQKLFPTQKDYMETDRRGRVSYNVCLSKVLLVRGT